MADMSLRLDFHLDDWEVDEESGSINSRSATTPPDYNDFSNLPSLGQIPPEAYPYEDFEAHTAQCLWLFDTLSFHSDNHSVGVYSICSKFLVAEHTVETAYMQNCAREGKPHSDYEENKYEIAQKLHKENPDLFSLDLFMSFNKAKDALSGETDKTVGGSFHDRVAVLANIISFIVSSEQLINKWVNVGQTPSKECMKSICQKYESYLSAIKELNVPESEKHAFLEWLENNFPLNIKQMWIDF